MFELRPLTRTVAFTAALPLVACGSLRSQELAPDASSTQDAAAAPDTGAPANDAGLPDATLPPPGTGADAGADGSPTAGDASSGVDAEAGAETGTPGDAGADAAKLACGDASYSDPWSPGYVQDPAVLARTSALVSSMTLTEQANQMRGTNPDDNQNFSDIYETPDDTVNDIKGFYFRDGSRGVNLAAATNGVIPSQGYSTAFPVSAARGAAFDMDLEYQIGAGIGDETLASGNTMLLAPSIDLLRHPAWGRAQESYGEDAFVVGRLGAAFTAGAQTFLPTCATHFAAYDIEDGREALNMQLDEQTLREFYTRPFEKVIQDGGSACVMAAYNLVNGTKSALNSDLLSSILRTDIGFKGFVLSDWWALPPGTETATDAQLQATAVAAISAGLDMELPWAYNYAEIEAVTGTGLPLDAGTIALSASRILEQKYRFKVDSIGSLPGLQTPTTVIDSNGSIENNAANIALALRAARESMVLLKNDASTLPISSSAKTIAVLGALVPFSTPGTTPASGTVDFATDVRLGDLGSSRVFSDPATSVGPFAGIQAAAGGGVTVVSGSDVSVAQDADFIVVVAGLTPEDEGEEYTGAGDRTTFALDGKSGSGAQNALIAQVVALGKPMVVVLEGGSVIDMPWLAQVPAVVMAWYPGMVGGTALGQLLFGQTSFSGKLPVTWPQQWSDEPPFNQGTTTQFDYYVGYHYFDQNAITPLFPFGAGLSYTTFAYANLDVPCATVTGGSVVNVQADITNTGAVTGDETAFLFVSYPSTAVRRPAKELKGFVRATVTPGQTVRVTIPLRISDLKYWDMTSSSWKIESGPVNVMVGSSAANLPLSDTITVQ